MPAGWRRFTILEHDHPHLHWDLLLDAGDALRTWRLLSPPACLQWIAAEQLPDHRRLYLDYEGPVSGNRGYVVQTHTGLYRRSDWSDALVSESPAGWEPVIGSDGTLELTDTELAARAICRRDGDHNWQWWFE